MTTTIETTDADRDYAFFCRMVYSHAGIDLAAYKRGQMERRIRAMADRAGHTALQSFWKHLQGNTLAMDEFLDRITINVSELFRNPEKFEELRLHILPELLRGSRRLTIWSAGCSYGAEAYSLRILLHRLNAGVNHRVLATDIDIRVLARARRGAFTEDDLKHVSPELRGQYFTETPAGPQVAPIVKQGVEFQRHDLLRDPFPEQVDLILCRNVVIYFTDDAKQQLFRRFFQALRPGGYLLVGSTERIFGSEEIGFRSPRPFFYQRP